jgi:hypothetical protein
MNRDRIPRLTQAAIASAAIVLGLGGCVSTPVPNEKIAVAKASVQRAEQSGGPELAPVEMAAAHDKLQRAEKAAADHDGDVAGQLADQANADAQLAEATAQQKRSAKAAAELDASLRDLRNESMRSTPAQPTQPTQPNQ